MAKKRDRAAIRKRKEAREQAKKQKQMVQIGAAVVGVLVIGLIAFFAVNAGNSGPEQPQARLDLDPVLGNPDAPISIVEYGAFGCHACRSWHEAGIIEGILAQYPDQVNFIYRDMPIIDPTWSQEMGEIAQCALDQGNDAFWVAHDVIYEDTVQGRSNTAETIDLIAAKNSGINIDDLRTCVDANTHFHTVRYDMERPEAVGIRGTPTWFVNGQQVYNASPQVITQMIEAALSG